MQFNRWTQYAVRLDRLIVCCCFLLLFFFSMITRAVRYDRLIVCSLFDEHAVFRCH